MRVIIRMAGPLLLFLLVAVCASPDAPRVRFAAADSTVAAIIGHSEFDWQLIRTTHFEIYYEPGTYPADHLGRIGELSEAAVVRALELLGERAFDRGLRLFMLESRDRMLPLVGSRPKGYTLVGHDAVLLVMNEDIRLYAGHEIFHAVSIELWGFPAPWVREGAAVFADGSCLDYVTPFHTIAGYLAREGMLLSCERLVAEFQQAAAANDMLAYMQAGSFFQYLYDTYDTGKIKRLWQDPPSEQDFIAGRPLNIWYGSGAASFPAIFGRTLKQLESDWLEFIARPEFERDVNWEELMDKGCG